MRKLILALVLAACSTTATPVMASSTTISVSPASSVAGQNVTITATFTSSCPGALTTHYFTIDGRAASGTLAQSGTTGTDTLATSALTAGAHSIWYYWGISGTICRGSASVTYTVAAASSPTPAPPSPTPTPRSSPTPSPAAVPTPVSSPTPVALVAGQRADSPLPGYAGAALIVLVLVAGAGLIVLSRR